MDTHVSLRDVCGERMSAFPGPFPNTFKTLWSRLCKRTSPESGKGSSERESRFFHEQVLANSSFLVSHRVHRASEKSWSGWVRGQSRAEQLPQFFLSKNWGRHLMHWVSRSVNSVGSRDSPQESAGKNGRENQLFASGNRVWICSGAEL